ncbi:MAG: HEAT repeat domain-containing protein [Candidatus Riflebacteria bacterium]|nr:HEAT repeat domain-containing protein [Candidatus Riflebacteria bacterium]
MSSENSPKWATDLDNSEWEKRFLSLKKASAIHGLDDWKTLDGEEKSAVSRKIVALLDDENSRVRSQAAAAIANLHISEAREALVTALADPNEWVRVQVADALATVGNPALAQVIADHLQDEQETHVRATLVKTLGCIGNEKMFPVLALYLEDPDGRVRANCVEALAKLKLEKSELKKSLVKMLNDPSNRVRANIALALVSIGDKKGREIICDMLNSDEEYMRASALYALGELNASEDRERIVKFFADPSWLVRKNAVRSISKHGKKAVPFLLESIKSACIQTRLGILDALRMIKDVSSRKVVIELLEDESGEVRSKAEETLDILDAL